MKKFIHGLFSLLERPSELKFRILIYVLSLAGLIAVSGSLGFQQTLEVDSIGYLFEAQLMSEGRLTLQLPQPDGPYQIASLVKDNGKMYGRYFPGHPALIAASIKIFGHPYPLIWLICAFTPLLLYLISRRLFPSSPLGLHRAIVLIVLLQFDYFLIESNLMSQGATTAGCLFAILALFTYEEQTSARKKILYALLAVTVLMALFTSRPVDSLMMFAFFGVLWLYRRIRRRDKTAIPILFISIFIAAFFIGLFLSFNKAVTGSYFTTPYQKYLPGDEPFRWGGCVRYNDCYMTCLTPPKILSNFFLNYRHSLGFSIPLRALDVIFYVPFMQGYFLLILDIVLMLALTLLIYLGWRRTNAFDQNNMTIIFGYCLFHVFVYSNFNGLLPEFYIHRAKFLMTLVLIHSVWNLELPTIKLDRYKAQYLMIPFLFYSMIGFAGLRYIDFRDGVVGHGELDNVIKKISVFDKSKKLVFVDADPPSCRPVDVFDRISNPPLLVFEFHFGIKYYLNPSLKGDPLVLKFTNTEEVCEVIRQHPDYKPYVWHPTPLKDNPKRWVVRLDELHLPCKHYLLDNK